MQRRAVKQHLRTHRVSHITHYTLSPPPTPLPTPLPTPQWHHLLHLLDCVANDLSSAGWLQHGPCLRSVERHQVSNKYGVAALLMATNIRSTAAASSTTSASLAGLLQNASDSNRAVAAPSFYSGWILYNAMYYHVDSRDCGWRQPWTLFDRVTASSSWRCWKHSCSS